MKKSECPLKWPKNALGHKLDMFESTVVLVRSPKEWNCAVSHLMGKPLSAIDPKKLQDEKGGFCGVASYYSKFDHKGTIFMVGVFDGRSRTLLHELTHTVFHICDYYGIPTNSGDANEFFCYMIEHLFTEFSKYCPK